MPAAGVEPVADVAGVAGLVGEVVELELHEHEQAVEPVAVAEDVAARREPVADLIEAAVQARRADDITALALPLGGAAFELRPYRVVPAVYLGSDFAQHRAVAVGGGAELLPAVEAVGRGLQALPDAVGVGVGL